MTQDTLECVVYRPLGRADAAPVARLHLDVFPVSRSTRLGESYLKASYRWLLHEPGFGIGAWQGNQLLGFVAGTPDHYTRSQSFALGPWFLLAIARRPWLLFESNMRFALNHRLHRFARKRESSAGGPVMALLSIGVSRAAQARGIGLALMAAFEEEAFRRGFRHLRLSVLRANVRAQRVYERAGWQGTTDPRDSNALNYTRTLK